STDRVDRCRSVSVELRRLFMKPIFELLLFRGTAGQSGRNRNVLGLLPIERLLPLVQLALPAAKGLALPALIGLGPLVGLGLLAVGARHRRLALHDVVLAAGQLRF